MVVSIDNEDTSITVSWPIMANTQATVYCGDTFKYHLYNNKNIHKNFTIFLTNTIKINGSSATFTGLIPLHMYRVSIEFEYRGKNFSSTLYASTSGTKKK